MKKILVPTDFSDISVNAMSYAIELAKKAKAELILFHSFYEPVFPHDSMLIEESVEAVEKECWENLDALKKAILKDTYDLQISYYCTPGLIIDEINTYAKEQQVDLIVVGAHGAGFLGEKLIGSTAASLIQNASVPLLVIDQHVQFKEPKTIVLAADFVETNNRLALKFLKDFINLFKAHLCVLNVYKEASVIPTIGEIVASFELDHSLKHIHHTFFYTNDSEIVEGINSFIKKQDIDMVVMISRKHSLIERVFREPYTKRMAFHSEVPFLALPE